MRIDVWFVMLPGVLSLDMTGPAETFVLAGDAFRLHYIGPQPEVPTSIGLTMSGIQPLPERLPGQPAGAARRERLPLSVLNAAGAADPALADAPAAADPAPGNHRDVRLFRALLAAKSGLLNNRQCTTHHDVISRLRTAAPTATIKENRIFVQDENIWTSAGITSGIDLALHMINRLCGPEKALAWRARWWSGSAVLVTIPSSPRGYATAIIFIRRFIGRRMRSPPSRKKRGACLISPRWRTSARAISPGFSRRI
jgi:putative intracellular protease/amidase